MGFLVNGAEIARLAGTSRPAVSMAARSGRLPRDPSGLYDLDAPAVKKWIAAHPDQRRAGAHTVAKHAKRKARATAAAPDDGEVGLSDFERRILLRVIVRVLPEDEDISDPDIARVDPSDPANLDFAMEADALRAGIERPLSVPRLSAIVLASNLHRLCAPLPPDVDFAALRQAVDKCFAMWALDTGLGDFEAALNELKTKE